MFDCSHSPVVYQDAKHGMVDSTVHNIQHAVANKWLVFVGDSTIRMLFHLLLGIVMFSWPEWPMGLSYHGPKWMNAQGCIPFGNRSESNKCLNDVYFKGMRFTLVWSDYGAREQLQPLITLARATAISSPSAIIVGIGAWHVAFRSLETEEFELHLMKMLHDLSGAFTDAHGAPEIQQPKSRHLVLGLNSCVRFERPKQAAMQILTEEGHSQAAIGTLLHEVAARKGWLFFDRALPTNGVCNATDCRFGGVHPTGESLNVVLKLMLLELFPSSNLRVHDAST
mmetsp:Transcript_49464/g.129054  ORF Transcript_49464/g.129054 Transcript_49464/m.129054 type:complete len:282 (+) Transcript_49464:104-949(+)|eukprot:CAMPEP_0115840148 /NCGR_PEP_ID=MMETSP0287-20121206/6621_1 /TAXON_ID=412157 /ORGANISM="Chrysochromulina rotalis, Strain UIO044" /LENGTH=281 /DNA_ID=CAMNT_0003293749 /DNA_START=47 /DNA_END=892 /DNA_ORIENTATION=+